MLADSSELIQRELASYNFVVSNLAHQVGKDKAVLPTICCGLTELLKVKQGPVKREPEESLEEDQDDIMNVDGQEIGHLEPSNANPTTLLYLIRFYLTDPARFCLTEERRVDYL